MESEYELIFDLLNFAISSDLEQTIIIIIIKNECYSNIIVDRLQGHTTLWC